MENRDDSEKLLFKFINPKLLRFIYEIEIVFVSKVQKFSNQALDNIEENAICGIQVPKRLIPKEYKNFL